MHPAGSCWGPKRSKKRRREREREGGRERDLEREARSPMRRGERGGSMVRECVMREGVMRRSDGKREWDEKPAR